MLALLATSVQPLLASAHNDSKSDSKGKSERSKGDDDNKKDDDDKRKKDSKKHDRKCLPWGIIRNWEIDKRLGNGKELPQGLFNRLIKCDNRNGTTTATTTRDTVAPRISDIRVSKATSTATVSWKTNESTTGSVKYGTNSSITSSSSTVADGSLILNHKVTLSGLTPNTTYYYVVTARDANGNTKDSSVLNFKTTSIPSAPEQDVIAPNITYATVVGLKATSTRLVWITNEPSDSKVWISTNSSINTSETPTISSSSQVYYHDVTLDNLATSTQYYYTINSTDAAGNRGVLTGNFFQTLAQ
ncbi:MAG: hypothetical protein QG640_671 [Patescibacteria group bacterium]|nr:hypothetical protein [Patescibacteria group bacterium]